VEVEVVVVVEMGVIHEEVYQEKEA